MPRLPIACTLACAFATNAHAGAGPWVLGKGDEQIYVGLDAQRFNRLAIDDGAYTDSVIDVDGGVTSFGAKLIGTVGLTRRLEIEFDLPYAYTYVNQPGAVCDLLGLDACETTQGIGTIAIRSKVLLVDELAGAPVSFSLGLDLRFGQLTAEHRQRITSLGEGTFDVEPRLSLGRIGSLRKGAGYWSLYADLGFRYRVPIDTAYGPDALWIPGFEITGNLENLWAPVQTVSFGPAIATLWRPNGVDFSATDLTDVDRIVALRMFALDVGGKIIIRNGRRVAVSASVFHTAYAINNPQDVVKVNVGVAIRDLFRKRQED